MYEICTQVLLMACPPESTIAWQYNSILNCWWKSMLGIITGNRPPRLDCLEMSRLATALLCHSPCLLDCYSNVLYLHCMQVLATAPLCHSLCWIAIHRQEILQPSRPISDPAAATTFFRSHNNNMYKAILSTAALLLLSCATAPCWTVIHRPSCMSRCLTFFPMPLL